MASATTMAVSFRLPHSPFSPTPTRLTSTSVRLAPSNKANSLKLSSSQTISGFNSVLTQKLSAVTPSPNSPRSLTIVAAKGYKMKTHKASAKRFRVTGRGKIHPVCKSDYDNVIKALPYLKVNRNAK
ncbi:hypothetical protein F8388_016135 [Cannabis sativa]|uniref:50S ribosomal protein L35 n=1 Tax=Cannabis sativa TaxID=3483 RepID=A0A7J6FIE9_CANSA|nr:hypothetical protein F8388_016135 [Cannabis sativa]